jgi:hypothetical protein
MRSAVAAASRGRCGGFVFFATDKRVGFDRAALAGFAAFDWSASLGI